MIKVLLVSLGCDKNLVDSEHMLGSLAENGYGFTDDEKEADVIIVNTCCFIQDALEESIETILSFQETAEHGNCKAFLVTGCLAQQYQQEILDELDFVDAVVGTNAYDELPAILADLLSGGKRKTVVRKLEGLPDAGSRIHTSVIHYSYLKIAEGCDRRCTYCVIPSVRGSYRSVPEETLLAEAEDLARDGVRELMIVAQDITLYGTDLYGRKCLPRLLKKLCRIEGLEWIRLLYCYPEDITDELIETIKTEPKICDYLDMPVQHCNNDILKKMGRRTTKEEILAKIARLRSEIPDVVLRTTLMTGFPGETPDQHNELVRFVRETEFDRLGVFPYSPVEGTPAFSMPDQIPEDIKQERYDELMTCQQQVSAKKNLAMKGRILPALVDGYLPDEDVFVARSYAHAPDIDGYVFIEGAPPLNSGDFVRCRITGALEYDLIGEMEDESAE